jgi:membrane-bound serine protease (ClpP class)
MSKNLIIPIVLQLIGVVVIIAELVLPSAGLLTIAALGLFGYSLFLVFTSISTAAGFTFLVIDLLLLPVFLILGVKLLAASPATLRESLKSQDGATSQPKSLIKLLGCDGIALTDLRPSGAALISGKRYDVVSTGEYIDKDSSIVVSIVNGNRIVVKKKI